MLIEQIIKFELMGPGSPGRTCNLYDERKIVKTNLRVNYYLLLKILQYKQCTLLPHGPSRVRNFTPKCKILDLF